MDGINPTRLHNIAVGQKIVEFRDMYGIGRSLLADSMGCSYPYLHRLERGVRGMSTYTFARLLIATESIQRQINWNRRNEYYRWRKEFVELVASYHSHSRGR
jgi:transcriptional regulator with XRE-family HTH domain